MYDEWETQWMEYLATERAGARATLSGWFTLLFSVLGISVAAVVALKREVPNENVLWAVTLFAWAVSVIGGTAYGWWQYLGTVRSISRRYLSPDRVATNPVPLRVRQIDYLESGVRDIGVLLSIVRSKESRDAWTPLVEASAPRSTLADDAAWMSRLCWGALIASLAALVTLVCLAAGIAFVTTAFVGTVLAIATVAVIGGAVSVFNFVRTVEGLLQERRWSGASHIEVFVPGTPYSQKSGPPTPGLLTWMATLTEGLGREPGLRSACIVRLDFFLPAESFQPENAQNPFGPDVDNLAAPVLDALAQSVLREVGGDGAIRELIVTKARVQREVRPGVRITARALAD